MRYFYRIFPLFKPVKNPCYDNVIPLQCIIMVNCSVFTEHIPRASMILMNFNMPIFNCLSYGSRYYHDKNDSRSFVDIILEFTKICSLQLQWKCNSTPLHMILLWVRIVSKIENVAVLGKQWTNWYNVFCVIGLMEPTTFKAYLYQRLRDPTFIFLFLSFNDASLLILFPNYCLWWIDKSSID